MKESEIVATIHIPLEYLKRWYNRKDRAASSDRENPPYVQLLNSEIIGKSLIKIDEICERKEGKLRRLECEPKAKYIIAKGGVAYRRLGNITKQLVVCVSFWPQFRIAGSMSRISVHELHFLMVAVFIHYMLHLYKPSWHFIFNQKLTH